MSFDTVKTFWKTVVEEREDFWASLFKKYEEDDQEVNLDSYLENSSNRMSNLLSLSLNEPLSIKKRFYEEQPGEASSLKSDEEPVLPSQQNEDVPDVEDSLKDNSESENDKPFTKIRPDFVSEIFVEDAGTKHYSKKFILVDTKPEMNKSCDVTTRQSISFDDDDDEPNRTIDSANLNVSITSVRHVVRRTKQRTNETSSPRKRFKLI